MDEPSKEQIPLNKREDFTLCLNCGFPNHNSVKRCMYCNTNLTKSSGLFSWFRQTFLILKWRWELKKERSKDENPLLLFSKKLGYLILGMGFSGFGCYLFVDSIANNSFSTAIISMLLLLYGFFTLKNLFSGK
jgi:hypothetical protein